MRLEEPQSSRTKCANLRRREGQSFFAERWRSRRFPNETPRPLSCGRRGRECSDPPRLRYANTGVFGGRVADLLRMTQTALTSPRTSGRTDQGKFTTYFTRNLAGDSRLTLDYCAELVTNAFRLTPSARRRDAPDSLLNSSKACLTHYNGPSKHFWRTRLT